MLLNVRFLKFLNECLKTLMIFVTILDAEDWRKMDEQGFLIDYQWVKFRNDRIE